MFVRVFRSLLPFIGGVLLISLPACAQKISNVRSEVRSSRVVITYDLEGRPGVRYNISMKAQRASGEVTKPSVVVGDLLEVSPGVGKTIWWEPALEGAEVTGWTCLVEVERETEFKWIRVDGGKFVMGKNPENADEGPPHVLTLSSFLMSATEVTFDQYSQFCVATGHALPDGKGWGNGNRPVIGVSWDDAEAFCAWASKTYRKRIRLPSEAEWEYAARGGQMASDLAYSGGRVLDRVAWYAANSGDQTQPVSGKLPNALGLYDMSGNVGEWCSDWYDPRYYSKSPQVDPHGPETGQGRVIRGGSWYDVAKSCRVAARDGNPPSSSSSYLGFRCVADP